MGLYLIAQAQFSGLLSFMMMAIGLGFVIFVHELGHFLVAKACGVKCEKFYVGFDFFDIKIGGLVLVPRSLLKFQWGETEYGIGIIPLGGYVKMLGQDDNPTKYADEMERSKADASPQDLADSAAGVEAPLRAETPGDQSPLQPPEKDQPEELDPRSYQAKTVFQRMAIISAGVIMNLIFAVIFATVAFGLGVSYQPCVIGGTVPGSPAWMAQIQPGDRILQIGRQGEPRQYIRFVWDLAQSVGTHGDSTDIDLLVQRADADQPDWISLRPRRNPAAGNLPSIGVLPSLTNQFSAKDPVVIPHSPADSTSPKIQPKDRIVAIDGESIDSAVRMREIFAQRTDIPLTVSIERNTADGESTEQLELTLPPNPIRRLGLWMEFGPIDAIQPDSPAQAAGLQVGDVLRSIDGVAIGDPLTLSRRLRTKQGQTVAVQVQRNQQTETLQVVPRLPLVPTRFQAGGPVGIEELGIAIPVYNRVAEVQDGSPAAATDIRTGDRIVEIELLPSSPEKKEIEGEYLSHKPIELKEEDQSWPFFLLNLIQVTLPDTKIRLTLRRGTEQFSAEMLPAKSEQTFAQTRGLFLQSYEETFTANSWTEAARFGLRQTWEDATRVLGFLNKLITGQVSILNLGGPGTIALVATNEASQGIARLLTFLTLLSANLAVVNFLPIPVLDGGHMMFLLYELIFRRKPSEVWFVRLSVVGLIFLLSLMLFVTSLDVFVRIPAYFGF